jgi:hypothetical protein
MLSRRRAAVATALAVAVAVALPASAGASIGFRGASKASAAGAHGVWVARPAGVQPGDVMVATVAVGGPHIALGAAGWTPLRTTTGGARLQVSSFYRVVTRYDLLAYYFGAASGSGDVTAGIAAYSGVDAARPIDAVADASGPGASSIPSVTTTAPGDVVVGAVALGSTVTATPAAAVAVRWAGGVGTAGLTVGDFAQPAAGATAAQPYTTAGPAGEKATQAMALRAPAEPVTPAPDPQPAPAAKARGWRLADGTTLTGGIAATLPVLSTARSARVSPSGRVPVAVRCPAAASAGCRGTIALTVLKPAAPRGSVTSARRRKLRRTRKVGFHLTAGHRRTLRAPLAVRALRRSVRRHRACVRMRVSVHTAAGTAVRSTTLTVHYRRTAHRRFRRRR